MTTFDDSVNDSPCAANGIARREDLKFSYVGTGLDVNNMVDDVDTTILPTDIFGITASGTNELDTAGVHISNIIASADFGRDNLNELGRKGPYHRFVRFPVEISCEIEVSSISGDMVSATEEGVFTTLPVGGCSNAGNLNNQTIRIATCEGTRIYLGAKNKLSSVNYSGADAGGGNVAVSYTYTTFNDFTVMHTGDPNTHYDSTDLTIRQMYLRDV